MSRNTILTPRTVFILLRTIRRLRYWWSPTNIALTISGEYPECLFQFNAKKPGMVDGGHSTFSIPHLRLSPAA